MRTDAEIWAGVHSDVAHLTITSYICTYMQEIDHPPDAPSLLESMRSIGYSVESALADIVDNSLAAKAKTISIEFRTDPSIYIAILDDGEGMTQRELEQAMRHGSTNPNALREQHDLGRYGLGLKTASLSQCRHLTVASLKEGKLVGYRWDLDLIVKRHAWTLLKLNRTELKQLPQVETLLRQDSGTVVIWQELDRMLAGESSPAHAIGRQMSIAGDHLSLVFHRYIAGEPGHQPLKIKFNQRALTAFDPFLLDHRATQRLVEESFQIEKKKVSVKAFVLPHLSKLSEADIAKAGGGEGLRHQQGFYVYRNRRLIIWGTWFRLAKKDELSKLARVRVDIPNSLDHLWTIDIKKSAAVPPEAVRVNLKRTIEKIRQASGRTLVFKGRQVKAGPTIPGWQEISGREGTRFDINRDHPLLAEFSSDLNNDQKKRFESTLRVIEQSFPSHALYAHMASDGRVNADSRGTEKDFREMITQLLESWSGSAKIKKTLFDNLHTIEPFSTSPAITIKLVQELIK